MQKINYDGEVFYYNENDGKFLDSTFAEVPVSINLKLAEQFYYNQDFKTFDVNNLFEFIKNSKNAGLFNLSKDACEFGVNKFSNDYGFMKKVLPIYTSNYRELRQPEKAIEIFKKYGSYQYQSIALFTSIAAAYTDLRDYETALKYANLAYARQGGGTGEKNELSLVYRRIKSETEKN